MQFYEHNFHYNDGSFHNLQSNTNYNIFFYYEECVSSCSHNDSCNFLPLPSILSSPCLPCSDVSSSLNSPLTLQIPLFFFVASPSNYATLDSIVSPPMSSTPHVNTNNHHIFTKGNAGIFKP